MTLIVLFLIETRNKQVDKTDCCFINARTTSIQKWDLNESFEGEELNIFRERWRSWTLRRIDNKEENLDKG